MAKKVLITAPNDEPLDQTNPCAGNSLSPMTPVCVVRGFNSLPVSADSQIIDVDVSDIEQSHVRDRLDVAIDDIEELKQQIEANGQMAPVLLRPHPDAGSKWRYRTIYGHRRILACAQLGRKVKAVVKEIGDEQALEFQGQKNIARSDLSFIEKATFALNIEQAGYPRETILVALSISTVTLSHYFNVVRSIPIELIRAIGKASDVGRNSWQQFARIVECIFPEQLDALTRELTEGAYKDLAGRDRFDAALEYLTLLLLPEEMGSGKFPDIVASQKDVDPSQQVDDAELEPQGEAAPVTPKAASEKDLKSEDDVESYFLADLPVRVEANSRAVRFKMALKGKPDFEAYAVRHIKLALEKALEEYEAEKSVK